MWRHISHLSLLFWGAPAATSQPAFPTGYSVYDYDLTTPRFTPDGRLMQVEYASLAPEGSSPLLALPVPLVGEVEVGEGLGGEIGSIAVVMAAFVGGGGGGEGPEGGGRRRRRGQSRIVALPTGPTPPTRSSPNRHIVLGLSGVLSDSVSLLRTARDHISSYGRAYGLHRLHPTTAYLSGSSGGGGVSRATLPHLTASSSPAASSPEVARRVARVIGDECQTRSFGGGIRPYGSSVLVCGVDGGGAVFCVTDAGGGVAVHRFLVSSSFSQDGAVAAAESSVVVGGSAAVRSRLRRVLGSRFIAATDGEGGAVRQAVEAVIGALLEVHSGGAFETLGISLTDDNKVGEDKKDRSGAPTLEVVVVTARGSHRLNDKQIERIISSINNSIPEKSEGSSSS